MKRSCKLITVLLILTAMISETAGAADSSLSDAVVLLTENEIQEERVQDNDVFSDEDQILTEEIAEDKVAVYESADPDYAEDVPEITAESINTAEDVTMEMCSPGYWFDKNKTSGIDIYRQLISPDEIKKLNAEMLNADGANMNDLDNMAGSYNSDELRKSLAAGTRPPKPVVYADGKEVDTEAYYKNLADGILSTGYTDQNRENQYAVAVKRTTVNNIPTDAYIGYSAADSDDEKVLSVLLVNEPFIIRQRAVIDGREFYWGYSGHCTGWVLSDDLAVCADKTEWLDAWKTELTEDDFIVVTQNQIRLEPSVSKPELSEVKLTFATILKLVPVDKYPDNIGERGTWNNYVVYLPVRGDDGSYVKAIALISQHYEVSTGFLNMTQAEILRVAFNSLGDRYGWGGMLDSMDCSLYTRNIYRCFGLEIPRNTTWQQLIPGRITDLSAMTDDEKLNALRCMPAGTMLYFPGHTMIYTGTAKASDREMAYVISDTGSLSDSSGEVKVRSMYSVILNPLTVRRRAGTTWLANITAAVLPVSEENMEAVKKRIEEQTPADPDDPEPVKRVHATEGQTYASSKDTLPLETFLGSVRKMYISFYNVDGSDVKELTATVLKGSVITSKSPVKDVYYDRGVATKKKSKLNGLMTITLKKSGKVTYEMEDGSTYVVDFTVQTPKAQTKAIRDLLERYKNEGVQSAELGIEQIFGMQIDSGELSIKSAANRDAVTVKDNVLVLNPNVKNSVRIRYRYLNKAYNMTVTVR